MTSSSDLSLMRSLPKIDLPCAGRAWPKMEAGRVGAYLRSPGPLPGGYDEEPREGPAAAAGASSGAGDGGACGSWTEAVVVGVTLR